MAVPALCDASHGQPLPTAKRSDARYPHGMSAAEVDAHLEAFPDRQSAALRATRDLIATALPGAEQVLSYGMPTFKIDGVAVVGIEGFAAHNSLFPYSGDVLRLIETEHADWIAGKGTVRFPQDEPFPAGMLKRIIALRIDEINASYPKKNGQVREFYRNGVLKAKGRLDAEGNLHGHWEWWRSDGSLMRTGSFRNGARTGAWLTYDGAEVTTTRY